ncbi:MAG: hypothetical protein GWN14_05170 [candidate division Zixibacteria bacterium]|nr:hypothetical protein [candidate division Zixibacteria bacterium]
MNRYIEEFLNLKCAPDVLATCSPVNNIGKEITEAMAICRRMRGVILKEPMNYGLYDLCAGNALTSVISVHLHPIKWAVAIDKKKRDRRWDLSRRFVYRKRNINDERIFCDDMSDTPFIVVAVHACRGLAERVIDLYKADEFARHLFLIPCCDGPEKNRVPYVIRKKIGGYLSWCWHLNDLCGGRLIIDRHIMSSRNAIIIASKS